MGELREVLDLIITLVCLGIFIGIFKADSASQKRRVAKNEARIEKHEDECKAQRESDRRETEERMTHIHDRITDLAIEQAKK